MKKFGLFIASTLLSLNTLASTEVDKEIDKLGVSGTQGFVTLVGGLNSVCPESKLYIDIETQSGRISYSTLLAIKMANKKLARVDYVVNHRTDLCEVSYVELGAAAP